MATAARMRTPASTQALSADDAREIAADAYIYAYPLVLMELTRRVMTNIDVPGPRKAPVNQFNHMRAFPDPTFTNVVRPNADTLYSSLWFDVASEPLVIDVPDSGGRYYLFQMMDFWTDVFASPGARTTGTGRQRIVIAGPRWSGDVPSDMSLIRSPTGSGWIVGRTQTNGTDDYESVHAFQDGVTATPFSRHDKPFAPPKGVVNPAWDMNTTPPAQLEQLSDEWFFTLFTQLTRANPPHANDYPIVHRMRRLGLAPGKMLMLSELASDAQRAIDGCGAAARKRIAETASRSGTLVNGWRINLTGVGTYGADNLHRAAVAYFALGANTIEDAIYPTAFTDADGRPLSSEDKYTLHFDKAQVPPARAFWSLTMYNHQQLFAGNPIDRYAIGDRDPLRFNADGSLDLYIQRESPGADKESNWLPAPESGPFTMTMRVYWPKQAVVDGMWSPPPVACAR